MEAASQVLVEFPASKMEPTTCKAARSQSHISLTQIQDEGVPPEMQETPHTSTSQPGPTLDQESHPVPLPEEPLLAEVHGELIPDLHLKLWDIFENAANLYPEHDALVSLWQPQDASFITSQQTFSGNDSHTLRWSYAHLREKAENLAACLTDLGCRPGMRLCVVLWNSAEWGLFFWAAAKLQVAFCPIDPTTPKDAKATIRALQPHVVVSQDADSASALDLVQTPLEGLGLRIHCTGQEVDGWTRMCDIPALAKMKVTIPSKKDSIDETGAALIVFTSGTTGEPKGCIHSHQNIVSECCDFDPEVNSDSFLRFLVHTPSSHIFAINNCLRAWRWGGTAVFPSRTFDVDATLQALVQERCSVMSATPTLVKALMAHPSFPNPETLDLRLVTIGGTSIGREDIELCRQGLGAQVAIQVFGMSEGAPLITFARTDPEYSGGYHPGVGKVLPGAKARVCHPSSREVLRRGDIGELHVGGTSVIDNYFNRERDDSMYDDEFGSWLVTGDQAKIDEDGIVYILGRYKDLIIRGGENIYPIRVESVLQQIPGVQTQVVGVKDDLAGQVPVAVAILPEGTTKSLLIEKSRSIEPRYTLSAVYTLDELGLDQFPVTSLGKVKKALLREKLEQLRQSKEPTPEPALQIQPSQKYIGKLLDIWEKLCGTRPSQSDNVLFLADSITLLRYCDSALRTCGQRLYLQDFTENESVEKQANLLLAREIQQVTLTLAQGPPSPSPSEDSVSNSTKPIQRAQPLVIRLEQNSRLSLATDEKDAWTSAQQTVLSAGLSKTDIEDVIVVRDSLHRTAIGPRPQSYHSRMVFQVRTTTYENIRHGLEKALASRPMLRTVVFETSNRTPHHAVLSSSPALFSKLIHDVQVPTDADALKRAQDDTSEAHNSPFMFQSDLVKVNARSQYFLIFTFNHSVIDVLSITQWHHELDRWIQDADLEFPALTPYRLFSDLFSQYEDSEPAQKSVMFHVKRLRGISRFGRALWPPQKAPGMMISNDQDYLFANERGKVRAQVWEGEWEKRAAEFQFPRSGRIVALPNLTSLREEHNILPSLFAKSAVVLFNVLQTGASHALFNSWESGRSWPFIPPWMERLLPPAMSIDGPTVQWLLNMCEVIPEETLIEFLHRIASEQEQMKQFEHVPWSRVVQGLRDEGDMAEAASFRQSFVWDMSMAMSLARGERTDFKMLEPVARYDWPDCGLFWNAFMIDSVNLYFIASWDTAQMNDREVDGHCDSLADVMRKLADKSNWDRKVAEVFI